MSSPEELQGDIERTRDQLGDTVEALVAKADVKGRAQRKAAQVKAEAQQKAAEVKAEAQRKAAEVKAEAQRKGAETAEQVTQQAKNLAEHLPDSPAKRSGGLIAAGLVMLAITWLIVRRARRAT